MVWRHLESALGHRAAHLPALHQAARRTTHPEGAQGRAHRHTHPGAGLRRRPGQAALVAFQRRRPRAAVRDGARRGVPLYQVARAEGRGRRRGGLNVQPPHEGCPLHDAHGPCAGQRGRPTRRHRHGRQRHQGRPLRVHARQDCHRRTERPVPHAAPHHPSDGGHDRPHAQGRDLRPGLRHGGLPRCRV